MYLIFICKHYNSCYAYFSAQLLDYNFDSTVRLHVDIMLSYHSDIGGGAWSRIHELYTGPKCEESNGRYNISESQIHRLMKQMWNTHTGRPFSCERCFGNCICDVLQVLNTCAFSVTDLLQGLDTCAFRSRLGYMCFFWMCWIHVLIMYCMI
jgi:hypothetical protein